MFLECLPGATHDSRTAARAVNKTDITPSVRELMEEIPLKSGNNTLDGSGIS